jgi:catechol 2,3-dioxygenase-like lactoylglutathione lyase family enzyme
MVPGWPSLCLDVRDLERSTRFYEALGMEVLPELSAPGARVVLRSGGFRMALFAGIGTNLLNIRGADVPAAHAAMTARFPGLEGEPERYTPGGANGADFAGWSWSTRDPDANVVLFDTNERETGEPYRRWRAERVLRDAEHELARIGADEDCLDALRALAVRMGPGG